jgi:hypothetical protein
MTHFCHARRRSDGTSFTGMIRGRREIELVVRYD